MELLRSQPFTVSRVALARAAAEAYFRSFWWFVVPGPLFGLVLLVLSPDRTIKAIAALGVLWPASIPARAYFLTSGLAKRLSKPTTLIVLPEGLFFSGETAQFKVVFDALRSIRERYGMFVMRTKKYDAILVPVEAFPEGSRDRFMEILRSHGIREESKTFLEL